MNNNIYIKYYLLLLLPLIINGFNLINSKLILHKLVVRNPKKMCSVRLSTGSPYRDDSSNYYLDNLNMNNLMNNFIKNNDVNDNFINTTLSLSSSPKIKTNTYYIDDMLIEKI
jgi:hypothetical protein